MPKHTDQQVVDSQKPSRADVVRKARTTGNEPRCARRWTDEENAFLERHYRSMTEAAMAAALGRSRLAVRYRRLNILRLPKAAAAERWTAENEAMLEALYGRVPPDFLAAVLSCSVPAMRQHAWHLGLQAPRLWSHEEDEILREHFPHSHITELAKLMPGRSPAGIYRRANALSIARTVPYLLSKWRYAKFNSYPPELRSLIRLHHQVQRRLQDVQAQH